MRLFIPMTVATTLHGCTSLADNNGLRSWCSQGRGPISSAWERLSDSSVGPVVSRPQDAARRLERRTFIRISADEARRLSNLAPRAGMRYYLTRGAVTARAAATRNEILAGVTARTIGVHWLPGNRTIGIVAFNSVAGEHREYNVPFVLETRNDVRNLVLRCVSYD